jgi:RHH-type proline utilization regulon transcriptional repressor/proline dehydrogenase/delta 1-pyrroline-5-carboxylate dehydrogenase
VQSTSGLFAAIASALATGNSIALTGPETVLKGLSGLPAALLKRITIANDGPAEGCTASVVLYEGDGDGLQQLNQHVASWGGAVVPVYGVSREGLESGRETFPIDRLLEEVVVSTNTAAAGGNASLMTIG